MDGLRITQPTDSTTQGRSYFYLKKKGQSPYVRIFRFQELAANGWNDKLLLFSFSWLLMFNLCVYSQYMQR